MRKKRKNKNITRSQAVKILSNPKFSNKLFKVMNEVSISFETLPPEYAGRAYQFDNLIVIDICKESNILDTFIHECLHIVDPEMKEELVRVITQLLYEGMNQYLRHFWYSKIFGSNKNRYLDTA